MVWHPLKRHVLEALRQDPAPYEDALEWDYSRYSRALGDPIPRRGRPVPEYRLVPQDGTP